MKLMAMSAAAPMIQAVAVCFSDSPSYDRTSNS